MANAKQLESMVNGSPIAVYSCDENGKITFFNKAAEILWGRTPELENDLWCGSLKSFYPDGNSIPIERYPMALTLQLGEYIDNEEIIIERPDGTRRTVLVYPRPFFDSDDRLLGGNNTIVDISQIKANEATQAMMASIVTSSEDAIISKDLTGRITSWNEKATELFGYSTAEAIGKSITMIIPERLMDEEVSIVEKIKRGESVRHFETERISMTGEVRNISLTISPIKNTKGEIIGASKIARDISELLFNRKKIKKYTKELESLNRYKDEFVSMASHELRTPLTTVKAYLQMLERVYADDGVGLNFTRKAINGVFRLEGLINDLLDISKIKIGQLEYNMAPVRSAEIIKNSVENLKYYSDTHEIIINELADVTLMADSVRLEQVLNNFLSNAIKYSPHADKVELDARQEGDNLIVSVKDYGIGIPFESIARLGEQYYRAENSAGVSSGLGIGLYLSQQILTKHEGRLLVESHLNQGSTFQFVLPVYRS